MNLPHLEPSELSLPPNEFGTVPQLLSDLGRGEDPVAVMLTCWELGTAPDQISLANPGEVMIVQNPGGLVPSAQMEIEGSSLNSVIYGLCHTSVKHLIVCGHTECKTLRLLIEHETKAKKNPFRDLMESVKNRFQSNYLNRTPREWPGIVVQEAVLLQLANLRSHAEIESQLERGELLLHGWVRDDKTSGIAALDPATGQFTG